MGIATSAAATLGEDGVKAALKRLWKQVSYVLDYKDNIEDLNAKIVALTDARARLQHQMDASRNRLEEIYEDVETWLKLADDRIAKAKAILEEDQKAKKSCCVGLVPNIKDRHKYSRKAKKEASMVETLEGKGGFDKVGYVVPPAGIVPPRGYEAFESRAGVFRAVVQALKEADVVGVWGPGGVGKTTLAKKVAESVKAEEVFTIVAMATIGQNPHINIIQREIAEWLGFEMKEETTEVRASQLLKRLKQEKSNILIVLDDVWKMVDLDAVGVPHGCKILLTSRSQQVLADMGARPDHCFQINILTKEEGLDFFQKNVGEIQDSVLQDLATEIVVRCGGLPVLILPIANALKNKVLIEWKDAFEELKKGDFEENAFPLLELSYKFLKEDEKSLFLLCGQVGPKYISFPKLFMYSIGLGFLRNYDTLEKAKNRLHKLVNNLRRSSLLENDNNNDETVQMHDVVHSFAISKQHSVIAVPRDGQLIEWPRRDELENCTSLLCEYFRNHPQILHCPRLKVLTLANGDLSGISQNFFSETKELRVLDLQAIRLSHLPSSFGFLMNLETLCLRDCEVEDISLIGDLEKLQVLCLQHSGLVCLPSSIGRLTGLRLLDLSYCYKLEMIAPNVLSCLTQLEELLMRGCPLRWEFQDENSGRNKAKLDELKSMPKLTRLEIEIRDARIIPNNWFPTKLETFNIILGDARATDGYFNWGNDASKTLKLIRLQKNDWPMKEVSAVVKRTEDLYMERLSGFGDDICKLDMEGFLPLKRLSIRKSHDIRYVINTTKRGYPARTIFPILESLRIDELPHMERMCHGLLTEGSLCNLTSLYVAWCPNLKYLFPSSMIESLIQLRELDISYCDSMKEIILSEDNVEKVTTVFPKLESLKMYFLRSLLTICTSCELLEFPSLKLLHIRDCSQLKTFVKGEPSTTTTALFDHKVVFPKLEDLHIHNIGEMDMIWHEKLHVESFGKLKSLRIYFAPALRRIFSSSMPRRIQNLNTLNIFSCDLLEDVFDSHILVNEDQPAVVTELKTIDLHYLPKLKHVWPVGLKGIVSFQNLTSVGVYDCKQLKSVFPASMCVELFQLERLEIKNCGMEHIIAVEEDGKYNSLSGEEGTVELPQLHRLYLQWLPQLTSICSTQNLAYTSSRSQDIAFDNNVESSSGSFFFNKVAFPNLERLTLDSIGAQKIWDNRFFKSYSGIGNLTSLSVRCCHNLKYLFPSSMIKSLVQLRKLDISYCDSMKEIILSEGDVEKVPMVFPKLESLYMHGLPSLLTICKSCELLEFPSLKLFNIKDCSQLKTLVKGEPSTTTSALFDHKVLFPKLEDLDIYNIGEMEMIWHEQLHVKSFGKLKRLEISWVPGLRRIFPSSMLRRIQNLNTLKIFSCDLLEEVFDSHILVNEDQPAVVTELNTIYLHYLPKLKHVWPVGLKGIVSFQNLTSVDFYYCEQLKSVFPASMCVELFQLERLEIKKCGMEHIIAMEKDGKYNSLSGEEETVELPQLHDLYLGDLPQLTSICSTQNLASTSSRSQDIASDNNVEPSSRSFFFNKVAFPNLEHLTLASIGDQKIWDNRFFKSFSGIGNLTSLSVERCRNLKYLFPSSVIESLVQLRRLDIRHCDSINEIILSEDDVEKVPMVFPKLESLYMYGLPSLLTICKSCELLEFPSLKLLHIGFCSRMKTLVKGEPSTTTIALFDHKVLFPKLEDLEIEYMEELEMIWHEQLHAESFGQLKSLQIAGAPALSRIFPSSMLRKIQNLNTFTISLCDSLEEVFDSHILVNEDQPAVVTKLKTIYLDHLPKLKHVWPAGLKGIVSFQNLTSVVVYDCEQLKSVFPASMCVELFQLEKLTIVRCGMEHIIAVEEGFELRDTFEFPCLNTVYLCNNSTLRGFYPEKRLIYLPALVTPYRPYVDLCPMLEIVSQPKIQWHQEDIKEMDREEAKAE